MKQVQTYLNRFGCNLVVDGIIGNKTKAEIKKYIFNQNKGITWVRCDDKLTNTFVYKQCHSSRFENTLRCIAENYTISRDVSNWIEIKDGRGKSYFEGTSHAAFIKYINEYKSK